MSDIERIPSIRKASRQGVPKRKPRDMATPAQSGKMKDAPAIPPRAMEPAAEPTLLEEPMLPLEPTLPLESMLLQDAAPGPEPGPEPEPEPDREPVARVEMEPAPVPEPESRPAPAPAPIAADAPPLTLREVVARVDAAWAVFRAAAYRFPAEYMNEHLTEDGWTRKQMLAHIAVWHDLTADRLVKLMLTGRPANLDRDMDAINGAAARVAIGKTAGEVLRDLDATFNRLRRQMLRLSEAQLRLDGAWAAQKIAGNTYEHYAEHIAELIPPQPLPTSDAQS